MIGIKFVDLAGGVTKGPKVLPVGQWLRSFNVDAFEGRGEADWTADPAEAMAFITHARAFAAWKTQSTIRPLRPDGKPNRPLTAFTVTIEAIP